LRLRWPSRTALAIAAAVACLLQVPGLLSTAEIRRSQAAERMGNAGLALAWANDAVGAQPWSASAYEQRSLVLEAAGQLTAAARDANSAISRERLNFSHWLILARIETERGRLHAALSDYKRAQQLRPLASVFAFAPFFKYPQGSLLP
jgi:tetratricopeptide (TPR) repeat protein